MGTTEIDGRQSRKRGKKFCDYNAFMAEMLDPEIWLSREANRDRRAQKSKKPRRYRDKLRWGTATK